MLKVHNLRFRHMRLYLFWKILFPCCDNRYQSSCSRLSTTRIGIKDNVDGAGSRQPIGLRTYIQFRPFWLHWCFTIKSARESFSAETVCKRQTINDYVHVLREYKTLSIAYPATFLVPLKEYDNISTTILFFFILPRVVNVIEILSVFYTKTA